MAIFAVVGRQDVGRILAAGDNAVVATAAVSTDVRMVEHGACPGEGSMAIVADIAALDVRRIFTGRGHAVVTTLATAEDGKVIDPGDGEPGVRLVAILTVACYPNMLAGSGAGPD